MNIRVEEISCKNPRLQSEIIQELGLDKEEKEVVEVHAPTSQTPEQIISFLRLRIQLTKETSMKSFYSRIIDIVNENGELKKQNLMLMAKIDKLTSVPDEDVNGDIEV